MRPLLHALFGVVVLFSFNACQTTPGKQEPNLGPFDSQGRYVDAWADDPSKWRPYTPKDVEVDPPRIASNEQPSPNSVPLPGPIASADVHPPHSGSGSPRTTTKVTSSKTKADTDRTAKTSSSKTKADTDRTTAKTGSSKTKVDTDRTSKTGSSKTKGDTDRTAKTSSKNQSSTAKTVPKPKSAVVHHTVKPGDSLYSIAAKYGCSVNALKEANGISGSIIRDGKSLVIPARK
ncbi:MAG: LysM peptidoglycan-binding domain-containing protein [Verrucomicrobiota bacterium]